MTSNNELDAGSEAAGMASSPQGQLFTVTLDTYKASRLNSILSQLDLRIDPIDQVLIERRRREASIRSRHQQQMRQLKVEQKLKEKEERSMKTKQNRRQNLQFNQQHLQYGP